VSAERLVRPPSSRVWMHRGALTVLGAHGRALRFDGASADLAQAVLEHLTLPRDRAELLAHLADLTGAPLTDTAVVDQLLTALRGVGAVVVHTPAPTAAPSGRRVVLGITGAIAAAHAPLLVSLCLREGWSVRLAATRNALRFVSARALEAIAHAPVHASHWHPPAGVTVPHIELARDAELVLVAPCSATTLSRIARGDCSDVVSATALSTRAPVLLAPSMNEAMYASEAVQRNLRQVRDDGFHVVLPTAGVEVAEAPRDRGPMLGPAPVADDLVAIARALLAAHTPTLPRDAAAWDAVWRGASVAALPWTVEAPEADLAAALSAFARTGAAALDLGTGAGTVARHLAAAGCRVTACDASPAAVAHARAAPGGEAIDWRVDDVTASALDGRFELVADRALLHVLPPSQRERWVDLVRRVAAPGAAVVALCHDASESGAAGTHGFAEAELRALLGGLCEEVRVASSVMRGPGGTRRRAWLATGRARG
jgi:2-polyprenyl-3-methyl-5-hydroxy-6-metoxy-1,4-benzoquinol methylase